jgi:hypothetical protein
MWWTKKVLVFTKTAEYTNHMMTENSNSQIHREAKSQLARLMANENLTVEHRAVRTAYFDVEKRLLVLPIWKNMTGNIYDTLVGHEVGHALDTPPSADILKNAIESIDAKNPHGSKMFLNVIEDGRIEKLVRRRYPGMRRSFSLGYKDLLDRNFFGTAGRSIKSYGLIDRINLHLKLGSAIIIDFTPAEKKLVEMAENCESFDDVVKAAQAIYTYCKEHKEDQPENDEENYYDDSEFYPDESGEFSMPYEDKSGEESGEESDEVDDSSSEDSDDSDESDKSDGKTSDEGSAGESGKDDEEEGSSDSEDDDSETSSSDEDEISDQKTKSPLDEGFRQNPTSETQESWESKKDELVREGTKGYVYVNIPEVNGHNWIVPYKQVHDGGNGFVGLSEVARRGDIYGFIPGHTKEQVLAECIKFRSENAAVISYMVKEFEMRKAADTYSRSSISKTGVINTNKLHTYKYNDDLFKRITNVPTGKNHGLVMFIDWSGSMTTSISGLIEQLVNMVMFCKRVQIPFDVYAFSNAYGHKNMSAEEISAIEARQHSYKDGDLLINSRLSLLQLLSSRMKEGEFNQAIGNLLMLCKFFRKMNAAVDIRPFTFGSTPLDATIVCATSIVNAFRAKHKLQIVNTVILTDGEDTDSIEVRNKGYNPYTQDVVLRDTVTKSEAVVDNLWDNSATTAIFLNRLRERTGTNVIGYYINSDRVNSMSFSQYSADPNQVEKLYKDYVKNKYIEVTNLGYSVYYILKAEEMNIQTTELNLGKATTAKSIAKVFAKYSKNKLDNRIVLSRFIEKISA